MKGLGNRNAFTIISGQKWAVPATYMLSHLVVLWILRFEQRFRGVLQQFLNNQDIFNPYPYLLARYATSQRTIEHVSGKIASAAQVP